MNFAKNKHLLKHVEQQKAKETKWKRRFLELAEFISNWSLDPNTKVGAVISKGNKIISVGYNGFPKNIKDDHRLENRDLKNKIVAHAEVNTILHAQKDLTGCTITTYPIPPCSQCATFIITAGISKVVAPLNIPDRWKESISLSIELFKEAGVICELIPNQQ